ncbi:MAG: class I SAM-dependent methyltransferase [Bacillota bacterium]
MSEIDENKIYFTEKEIINIDKEKDINRVLDIGGGGESVIAHLYGDRVISIDLSKEELLEADDNESLKIIMDAREMDFLDNQFELCTSFFTFMYLEKSDYEKVFKEVKRVLKPEGKFIIWDLSIPEKNREDKDFYAVKLEVRFNNKKVDTAYGTYWKENSQKIDDFVDLAHKNNLEVIKKEKDNHYFYLELKNI